MRRAVGFVSRSLMERLVSTRASLGGGGRKLAKHLARHRLAHGAAGATPDPTALSRHDTPSDTLSSLRRRRHQRRATASALHTARVAEAMTWSTVREAAVLGELLQPAQPAHVRVGLPVVVGEHSGS